MFCKKHDRYCATYLFRTGHLCPVCLIEERDELAHLVNSLANIIINRGTRLKFLSQNELDVANDAIERVVPLLKGDKASER